LLFLHLEQLEQPSKDHDHHLIFRESGGTGLGGVAATSARVEQDVLDKLREFDIEEVAGPLAQHGFKKMRTLQKMEDRFPKDIVCSQLQR
jgi:hypothetical protein